MSFEQDEEILQDFLIEAGEILETLSEQLVELENDPDNAELLNAIFRGFHTIKGGAGFLALHNLVEVCHGAENIFDLLRSGKRSVTSELMDVILQALDLVNEMFIQVQNGEELVKASTELLAELDRLSQPETSSSVPVVEAVETSAEGSTATDEMSEDEFERLLDELHGGASATAAPAPAAPTPVPDSNDISDDEFESLLDELHGQGAFSPEISDNKASTTTNSSSDEISDDDFEALLDELHGQGQAPKITTTPTPAVPSPTPVAKTPVAKAPVAKPVAAKPTVKAKSAVKAPV